MSPHPRPDCASSSKTGGNASAPSTIRSGGCVSAGVPLVSQRWPLSSRSRGRTENRGDVIAPRTTASFPPRSTASAFEQDTPTPGFFRWFGSVPPLPPTPTRLRERA